jgi:two-component system phosphate regulon response regulator OmpR
MAERVLMIEDDGRLAEMVSSYLGEHGYSVEIRTDAASGLERIRTGAFDILLLDVMLPDLDGFEVCRRVREGSDLPVLMLTARGEETDRIVGLELGADDYLPKPFNPRELLARMRAVLRRRVKGVPTGDAAPPLRFGRLEIDRDARAVRLDGGLRSLTSYQFELLRILAESAGRVVSRETLLDRLRGDALTAFDRSIDVHVSRIRAVIEDDPKHPTRLLTVRGVGYLFARSQDGEAPA